MNLFSAGYKPCPSTHPWEFDNMYDYPMCCPEKPDENKDRTGFECDYGSIYREYDYGDDNDGKNLL